MKIETITNTHKGHSVRYSNGIEVTYDAAGIAEINAEDGQFLIDKYIGQIFPAGKVEMPMTRTPALATGTKNTEAIEELKDRLQKANSLINDYKAQANQSKEGERGWRIKCEELLKENQMLRGQLTSETKADKKEEPKDETLQLREQLTTKSVRELQKIVEELKLPDVDFKKMNKSKLIDLLIQVTTNG
jgi:hypothetical protein